MTIKSLGENSEQEGIKWQITLPSGILIAAEGGNSSVEKLSKLDYKLLIEFMLEKLQMEPPVIDIGYSDMILVFDNEDLFTKWITILINENIQDFYV